MGKLEIHNWLGDIVASIQTAACALQERRMMGLHPHFHSPRKNGNTVFMKGSCTHYSTIT